MKRQVDRLRQGPADALRAGDRPDSKGSQVRGDDLATEEHLAVHNGPDTGEMEAPARHGLPAASDPVPATQPIARQHPGVPRPDQAVPIFSEALPLDVQTALTDIRTGNGREVTAHLLLPEEEASLFDASDADQAMAVTATWLSGWDEVPAHHRLGAVRIMLTVLTQRPDPELLLEVVRLGGDVFAVGGDFDVELTFFQPDGAQPIWLSVAA